MKGMRLSFDAGWLTVVFDTSTWPAPASMVITCTSVLPLCLAAHALSGHVAVTGPLRHGTFMMRHGNLWMLADLRTAPSGADLGASAEDDDTEGGYEDVVLLWRHGFQNIPEASGKPQLERLELVAVSPACFGASDAPCTQERDRTCGKKKRFTNRSSRKGMGRYPYGKRLRSVQADALEGDDAALPSEDCAGGRRERLGLCFRAQKDAVNLGQ